MTREEFYSRLNKAKEEMLKASYTFDEDGGLEIYTDYRDREISTDKLGEFMESENPFEAFDDYLCEYEFEYDCEFAFVEAEKEITNYLDEEMLKTIEEHKEEYDEWVRENFYAHYDRNDFNTDVKVAIALDTGNLNSDFTKDNVLNWYGNNGKFAEESSVLWLARQQGKEELLRKEVQKTYNAYTNNEQEYCDTTECEDTFTSLIPKERKTEKLWDIINVQVSQRVSTDFYIAVPHDINVNVETKYESIIMANLDKAWEQRFKYGYEIVGTCIKETALTEEDVCDAENYSFPSDFNDEKYWNEDNTREMED